MIYRERKRERERGWGWVGGGKGVRTWCKPFGEGSRGCQHSLLCLNWKGSDRIYSMPANSLNLAVFLYIFFFISSHIQKIWVSEALRKSVHIYVHTQAHSHPQRWNDGHWLESVFVILILCFFTSPSPGPSPLLSLLLLLQSGRLGAIWKSENKVALRREKSQERETKKWKREQKGEEVNVFPQQPSMS